MALIRWGFPERLFDLDIARHSFGGDLAIDLYEQDNNIIAEMNLPGLDPDKIDVSLEDQHHLRISGKREEKKETKEKHFYSKEIYVGSFERCIALPAAVQADKMTAEYHSGVLKVIMPKQIEKAAEKVKITVKK